MRTKVTSHVRVITSAGEETVRTILNLRRVSLPDSWRWEDEEELGAYYRETLADPKHIHLFLEDADIPVGFLHAGPHDHFLEELREFDPAFGPDPGRYYVETLFIHPDHRSGHRFMRLIGVLCENFFLDGQETGFTRDILLPAVERIRLEYGIKPLIVPLLDPAVAEETTWWCHPAEVEAHLLATLGPEYAGHRPRKR